MDVPARLAERIRRQGPLTFEEFQDEALYGQEGFYTATSRRAGAGRRGDFLTSPEVGPLFGAVLARALDAWWEQLGRPDPYVVVDAGAGPGGLAAAVLAASPTCAPALRLVLVDVSPAQRALQDERLPLEDPVLVLGAARAGDVERRPIEGGGPLVTALGELPAVEIEGVVLANELLDNLPVRLVEARAEGWSEVRVGLDGDRLVEVLVLAPDDLAEEAAALAPHAAPGARIPVQRRARAWLRDALALVARGRVVVLDYADTTPALAAREWRSWLRTFRSHGPGGEPLDAPGAQDVTCVVCVDQLARVAAPVTERDQATFLRFHGLDELVEEGRAVWRERAAIGDLAAVRARSRVGEAAALADPHGLGAHRVLEWAR